MTLAQFTALAKRYTETQERLDFRSAIICTCLTGTAPKEFMLTHSAGKHRRGKAQSAQEMYDQMKMITAMMGGKVVIAE